MRGMVKEGEGYVVEDGLGGYGRGVIWEGGWGGVGEGRGVWESG